MRHSEWEATGVAFAAPHSGAALPDADRSRHSVVYKSAVQGSHMDASLAGVTNDPDSGVTSPEIGPLNHDLVQSLRVSFNAADVRSQMAAASADLAAFATGVSMPVEESGAAMGMEMVKI